MAKPVIEFRWLQKIDPETDEKTGAPVLQWRHKFGADADGRFAEFWEWKPWADVPMVEEYDCQ